ncbi:MAG TPA: 4,5-DOPA dioxygenase extradiol [Candidatus Sulfotelmatobacter sp.]|nr:4,5-DOPA dioxygenase extradiol [Candidatus Sulfotelmatobacter sp.]
MPTMPVVFFGHGSPMNALETNPTTEAWAKLGVGLPRPRAILAVSAHWFIPGTKVTAAEQPRTIHDFGGFPRALYEMSYRAPGAPWLADRVAALLAPAPVARDTSWGLDHGTWSVLVHAFPAADVPVVQLSIDETQPPAFHYELGRKLAPLRDEGVLLIGSGNVVHNLEALAWGRHEPRPYDWADRFETIVRGALETGDDAALVDYGRHGGDALLAVPTPEHYLPLLYVLGARRIDDAVRFPVSGVQLGSISMLTAVLG